MSALDRTRSFDKLSALLKTDPDNENLRGDCVRLAIAERRMEEADALTGTAMQKFPSDARARFDRSFYLIAIRNYLEAAHILSTLLAEGHSEPGITINLGLCYYALGSYDKAVDTLFETYRRGTRSSDLLRLLVSSLHHLDRLPEAISIAKENADEKMCTGPVAGVYALAYFDSDERSLAAKYASLALQHDEHSIDGLIVKGSLELLSNNFEAARKKFETVTALSTDNGRAALGLGALALTQSNAQQAEHFFSSAVRSMPRHLGSLHMLGWTRILLDNLDGAQSVFNNALQIDRNFAETYGALATVEILKGHLPRATELILIGEKLDNRALSPKFARKLLECPNDLDARKSILYGLMQAVPTDARNIIDVALGKSRKH